MKMLPHPRYYEGILQLRPAQKEVLEWVKKTTKDEGKAFIVKEERVPGGIDLYFSSQRYLLALGKKIKQRFGGVLVVSRKLHTVKKITSRRVYRVTALYRGLAAKPGEVVKLRGEIHKVVSVGARITTKNLATGELRLWGAKEFQQEVSKA